MDNWEETVNKLEKDWQIPENARERMSFCNQFIGKEKTGLLRNVRSSPTIIHRM